MDIVIKQRLELGVFLIGGFLTVVLWIWQLGVFNMRQEQKISSKPNLFILIPLICGFILAVHSDYWPTFHLTLPFSLSILMVGVVIFVSLKQADTECQYLRLSEMLIISIAPVLVTTLIFSMGIIVRGELGSYVLWVHILAFLMACVCFAVIALMDLRSKGRDIIEEVGRKVFLNLALWGGISLICWLMYDRIFWPI